MSESNSREVSNFDVWCNFAQESTYCHRPNSSTQWFCMNCGATDHERIGK